MGCFWAVLESILMHYTTLECTTEGYKESPKPFDFIGFEGSEPGGIRTHDLLIRSQHSNPLQPLAYKAFKVRSILNGLFLGCVIPYTCPVSHGSAWLLQRAYHADTHTESSCSPVVRHARSDNPGSGLPLLCEVYQHRRTPGRGKP